MDIPRVREQEEHRMSADASRTHGTARLRRLFRAFRARNDRLYVAGQSLSSIGTWMQHAFVYHGLYGDGTRGEPGGWQHGDAAHCAPDGTDRWPLLPGRGPGVRPPPARPAGDDPASLCHQGTPSGHRGTGADRHGSQSPCAPLAGVYGGLMFKSP